MPNHLMLGVASVVLAGIMEGTFAVPARYTPRWNWEHIWGAGSLMSLLLVAWPVTLLTIPNLRAIYAEAGLKNIVMPTLLGLGWGAGSIFFGLGVNAMGVALGVSLIMGLIAIVGSLLPLIMYRPEQLARPAGQLMVAALFVMLMGIVLCGIAGHMREVALQKNTHTDMVTAVGEIQSNKKSVDRKHPSYMLGITFCILSGILSPMVNFALIRGETLRTLAIQHGASSLLAVNAVWLLVFNAAYGLFVFYALFLMLRSKTVSSLRAPASGRYWFIAAVMGFLWAGGIVAYGLGAAYMGGFGAYAGWPLMLITAVAASNVSGIVIGEWKRTGTKPLRTMGIALVVLFFAAIMLGIANRTLTS